VAPVESWLIGAASIITASAVVWAGQQVADAVDDLTTQIERNERRSRRNRRAVRILLEQSETVEVPTDRLHPEGTEQ